MDPYKVVHGRDHVGKVGILSGGRGVCVISQECYRAASGQLVSQCYKPGDTAGHLHLRMARSSKKEIQHHLHMAKKFKRGNLTPLRLWQINSKTGNMTPLWQESADLLHLPEHSLL